MEIEKMTKMTIAFQTAFKDQIRKPLDQLGSWPKHGATIIKNVGSSGSLIDDSKVWDPGVTALNVLDLNAPPGAGIKTNAEVNSADKASGLLSLELPLWYNPKHKDVRGYYEVQADRKQPRPLK